uniref:EGF-like domain-containing protein n=1 Tax=Parascaris univalens TaxID=6257 RepID=A0A915BN01_PARUN
LNANICILTTADMLRIIISILIISRSPTLVSTQETIEDNLRNGLQSIGSGLNKSATELIKSIDHINNTLQTELAPCGQEECSHHGTCIGNKKSYICVCQIGYSGVHCEESPCDSVRDCNGKGLCIGTASSYTCMCQIGYSGQRCELIVG